jgi:hypothetical protein
MAFDEHLRVRLVAFGLALIGSEGAHRAALLVDPAGRWPDAS